MQVILIIVTKTDLLNIILNLMVRNKTKAGKSAKVTSRSARPINDPVRPIQTASPLTNVLSGSLPPLQGTTTLDVPGIVRDVITRRLRDSAKAEPDALSDILTVLAPTVILFVDDVRDDSEGDSLVQDLVQAVTRDLLGLVSLVSVTGVLDATSVTQRAAFPSALASALPDAGSDNVRGLVFDAFCSIYFTVNAFISEEPTITIGA